MKRFGKMLAVILSAVLLLFVGAMFGPRTAHALVATLVQVANTPTTAIPTVQAPAASALQVTSCIGSFNGTGFASCALSPGVPAGKTLIAEAVSIESITYAGADPSDAFVSTGPPVLGPVSPILYIPMFRQSTTNFPATSTSTNPLLEFAISTARGYFPNDTFIGNWSGTLLSIPPVGTALFCNVDLSGNSYGAFICTVSGYLVPAS